MPLNKVRGYHWTPRGKLPPSAGNFPRDVTVCRGLVVNRESVADGATMLVFALDLPLGQFDLFALNVA